MSATEAIVAQKHPWPEREIAEAMEAKWDPALKMIDALADWTIDLIRERHELLAALRMIADGQDDPAWMRTKARKAISEVTA